MSKSELERKKEFCNLFWFIVYGSVLCLIISATMVLYPLQWYYLIDGLYKTVSNFCIKISEMVK